MKQSEIRKCLQMYRNSVETYCRLIDLFAAIEASLAGMPRRFPGRLALQDAESGLSCLGDALSMVPQLVELVEEERRLGAMIRQQAARAGIALRYDEPPEQPEDDHDLEAPGDLYRLGGLDGWRGPDDWNELLTLDLLDLEDLE